MSQKVVIASKNTWTTVGHNSLSGTRRNVRLVCAKADAETVFASLTNGAWYATLGELTNAKITVGGYYDRNASSVTMGEAYATLNLVFDSQSVQDLTIGTGTNSNRYDPVYNLSTNTEERPIEQHPNFVCSWAYNLYQLLPNGSTTTTVPAWAATDNTPAGGTRTTPVAREPDYIWSRTQPASPDAEHYYKQVKAAQKFGVDTYLVPSSVVTSVIYYTNRTIKNSDLLKVGRLKAPGYTYNLSPASNQYWLITGSGVQEASKDLMVVTTSYQFAENAWDTAIYDFAT